MKKILALSFLVAACSSTPKMSPQQIRAMQMRTWGDSYDNVFHAFKTILQDDGYVIKNQDLAGGLIVATVQKTDSMSGFNAFFNSGSNYRTGEGFEVSVNLEKVGNSVETRVIVQELAQYSMGGQQGESVLDPAMYKNIYDKVSVEIKRRQAQGKN